MVGTRFISGPGGRLLNRRELNERKKQNEKRTKRQLLARQDSADPNLVSQAGEFAKADAVLEASAAGLTADLISAAKTLSKEHHIAAVMRAYAFWILAGQIPTYRSQLDQLREEKKPSRGPVPPDINLIVEQFISYGEVSTSSRHRSRLYSRDASAIRYLNSKCIGPVQGISLANEVGQGLDKWARLSHEATGSGVAGVNPSAPPEQIDRDDKISQSVASPPLTSVGCWGMQENLKSADDQPPDDASPSALSVSISWQDENGTTEKFSIPINDRSRQALLEIRMQLDALCADL